MGQRASRCCVRPDAGNAAADLPADLDGIQHACDALMASPTLPPASAVHLAEIRRAIESLRAIESGAKVLPWTPALPQEQVEWKSLTAEGGQLLKAFVASCLESALCGEGMGRLFMSDRGLLFEGVSGATGLLRWEKITVSRLHGTELAIDSPSERSALGESGTLRLRLALEAQCAEVYKCWMLCRSSAITFQTAAFHSQTEVEGQNLHNKVDYESGQGDVAFDPVQALTDSFIEAAARMPSPRSPLTKEPLYTEYLPGLSLDKVKSLLGSGDWVLSDVFQEAQGAFDLASTKVSDCDRFPGTTVRRITCMVPMPPDVPKAVLRMTNSPLQVNLASQCSVAIDKDEVILLWDSYTRGAMFSERFFAHNYSSFKSRPEGGVDYTFFAEANWLSPLPAFFVLVKKVIEAQTKKRALLMAQTFSRVLREGDAPVETS